MGDRKALKEKKALKWPSPRLNKTAGHLVAILSRLLSATEKKCGDLKIMYPKVLPEGIQRAKSFLALLGIFWPVELGWKLFLKVKSLISHMWRTLSEVPSVGSKINLEMKFMT